MGADALKYVVMAISREDEYLFLLTQKQWDEYQETRDGWFYLSDHESIVQLSSLKAVFDRVREDGLVIEDASTCTAY